MTIQIPTGVIFVLLGTGITVGAGLGRIGFVGTMVAALVLILVGGWSALRTLWRRTMRAFGVDDPDPASVLADAGFTKESSRDALATNDARSRGLDDPKHDGQ